MSGINVRDSVRDAALNARFGGAFSGGSLPPSLILNCSVSFPGLLGIYRSFEAVPVDALHHAMHQAWGGIAKYHKEIKEKGRLPRLGIVHSQGKIEFVVSCGEWVLVPNNRIIFPVGPLHYLHPINSLLGQDISGELWVNQGLNETHSALLLNC